MELRMYKSAPKGLLLSDARKAKKDFKSWSQMDAFGIK
jgi:hypothetical protein